MRKTRVLIPGVGITTLALALSACSSGPFASSGGSESASGAQPGKKAKLAVILPLGGDDPTESIGVRNAAQLAVDQANAAKTTPGWTFELKVLDDKGDPAQASAAAKEAAGDDEVIAVVGSEYSGTTKALLPALSAAGIATLSPSATNPALTRGDAFAAKPARPFANFFRAIPSDDSQGPALAKYLNAQSITRVAAVHDGDDYGSGLYATFAKAFKGTIVSTDVVSPGKATNPVLVRKLVASTPQAVFYGGWDAEAGPLSLALKEAGLTAPIIGGDGLYTNAYVPLSGPVSAGDIASIPGRPVDTQEAGRRFAADYDAANFKDGPGKFGGQGYDAATAALRAASAALPSAQSAKDARAAITEALGKVSFEGATGKIAFDDFGDLTARAVTINAVAKGDWTTAEVIEP